MSITLITGGARSGKSSYALKLAKSAKSPYYIATGWVDDNDKEMEDRILKHQQERGKHWITIEEQINLISAVADAVKNNSDMIIVDCLTFWTSNMMFAENNIKLSIKKLFEYLKTVKTDIIFVTNEVGSGIVPERPLGREFRDESGRVNQEFAKFANKVYLVVSGIPINIKTKE